VAPRALGTAWEEWLVLHVYETYTDDGR